jgi:hypothetical protein
MVFHEFLSFFGSGEHSACTPQVCLNAIAEWGSLQRRVGVIAIAVFEFTMDHNVIASMGRIFPSSFICAFESYACLSLGTCWDAHDNLVDFLLWRCVYMLRRGLIVFRFWVCKKDHAVRKFAV